MKKHIHRISSVGLMAWVLLSGTFTQCSVPGPDDPLKDALIWRITGNDLPAPSFLFGTVHVMDSAGLAIHSTIIEQLKRSEALVLETDLSDPQYQQQALQLAMMQDDSLSGILSPGQFRFVKDFFRQEFDFPVEVVKTMKPFYLASLMGALDAKGQSKSHEEVLLEVAAREQKLIRGIATLEEEAEIIDGIGLEDQVSYLLNEIKAYQNRESEILRNKIMQAYEKADINQIDALMTASMKASPEVYDQLFVSRNSAWLPAMIGLMQDQSCFFAVGVGHLPGESGLIRLLRERGFKVSPVHMDFWFHDR